jgi:hypothetical protein
MANCAATMPSTTTGDRRSKRKPGSSAVPRRRRTRAAVERRRGTRRDALHRGRLRVGSIKPASAPELDDPGLLASARLAWNAGGGPPVLTVQDERERHVRARRGEEYVARKLRIQVGMGGRGEARLPRSDAEPSPFKRLRLGGPGLLFRSRGHRQVFRGDRRGHGRGRGRLRLSWRRSAGPGPRSSLP